MFRNPFNQACWIDDDRARHTSHERLNPPRSLPEPFYYGGSSNHPPEYRLADQPSPMARQAMRFAAY